jgi:hypothetical protein
MASAAFAMTMILDGNKYKIFTWVKWCDRNNLSGIKSPGVYVIAISNRNISKRSFSWRKEIVYIGVTISKGGLQSRLQQFDNTLNWKKGHGGAERFRKIHRHYNKLVSKLFVSVNYTECNVKPNPPTPPNLRLMGKVLQQEYECFAVFVEKFKEWPRFNDKKNSPKK